MHRIPALGRRTVTNLFNFEMIAVVAEALLESRLDFPPLLLAPQREPLSALLASDFDFDPHDF